jgi:nucleotide-binding universal stress UspA family protein
MSTTGALEITILHVVPPGRSTNDPRLGLTDTREMLDADGVRLKVVESANPQDAVLQESYQDYDLVVIGVSEEWGLQPTLFSRRHEELARSCPASMLMIRKFIPEGHEASPEDQRAPATVTA